MADINVTIEDAQPISVSVENAQPINVSLGEAVNNYLLPGPKGDTGEQGPQGLTGPKGDQGEPGQDGAQGLQGTPGVKGDDGYTPIKGVDYFDGEDGADGAQGIPGVKGDTGIQGIQGIPGEKGEKGDKGDKGDTGEKGDTGIQGIQGPKGDKGENGADGTDALSSITGIRMDTNIAKYPDKFTKIESFNTVVGDYYGAGTITLDTTDSVDGGGSCKIALPTGTTIAGGLINYTTADWSKQNFSIWVKADDWSKVNEVQLLLLSGGSYSDGTAFRLNIQQFIVAPSNNEWIQLIFNREQFMTVGSADWTDIQRIIVRGSAKSGQTANIWFDQFVVFPEAKKGYISIDFDDGWAEIYTAANYMSTKGLIGSLHIIPELVGTTGYMTQAQIDDLARRGWDMSGHGMTNLQTLYNTSPATAEADIKASKQYLIDHGYKGSDIYAYPEGVNSLGIRRLVGKYYSAARDVLFISQPSAWVAPMNIHCFAAIEGTLLVDMQARVDDVLTKCTWQVFTFHKIKDTPTPGSTTEWSTANFEALIDYIAASGQTCLPKSQVMLKLNAPDASGAAGITTTGGSTGDVLTQQSDGTFSPATPSGSTPYNAYNDVDNKVIVIEDFLNAAIGSIFGSVVAGTGAAATIENPFTYDGIGIIKLTTGSTATGSAYVGTAAGTGTSVIFGGSGLVQRAKFRAAVGALSSGTNEFAVRVGFLDATTSEATDGAYFEYDRTASTYWRIVTSSNSTRTKTDTAVSVDTGYHVFEVVVSSGTASFYIDKTLVGTQSTNLPTGSSRSTGVGAGIIKSVGTGFTYYRVDYIAFEATVSR